MLDRNLRLLHGPNGTFSVGDLIEQIKQDIIPDIRAQVEAAVIADLRTLLGQTPARPT